MADTRQHVPTDELRAKVSALTAFGITQENIASYIGINFKTLTKYYQHELDTGQTHATVQVAQRLFKKATEDEDLTAIIFWLKTRAKWREKDTSEDSKMQSLVEKLVDKLAD